MNSLPALVAALILALSAFTLTGYVIKQAGDAKRVAPAIAAVAGVVTAVAGLVAAVMAGVGQ